MSDNCKYCIHCKQGFYCMQNHIRSHNVRLRHLNHLLPFLFVNIHRKLAVCQRFFSTFCCLELSVEEAGNCGEASEEDGAIGSSLLAIGIGMGASGWENGMKLWGEVSKAPLPCAVAGGCRSGIVRPKSSPW